MWRNLDKCVGGHILSAPHRLLLTPKFLRFNAASLYYNPRERLSGLQANNQYNCFAVSALSQALT
jgi:hypothetical protein